MEDVVWLRKHCDSGGKGAGTVPVRRCNKKKSIRVMDGFACFGGCAVCRGVVRQVFGGRLPR